MPKQKAKKRGNADAVLPKVDLIAVEDVVDDDDSGWIGEDNLTEALAGGAIPAAKTSAAKSSSDPLYRLESDDQSNSFRVFTITRHAPCWLGHGSVQVVSATLIPPYKSRGQRALLCVEVDGVQTVLTSLSPGLCEHVTLDLVFAPEDKAVFFVDGEGTLAITAYSMDDETEEFGLPPLQPYRLPSSQRGAKSDKNSKEKQKKEKKEKKKEQKKKEKKNKCESEKEPSKKKEAAPKKQPVEYNKGGVTVKVARQGNGPSAANGQMVRVKYRGFLVESGKRFDQGSIEFCLGSGDVISGWDVGIAGLKKGGKAELTIPPKMGYGNKRIGKIPAKSTLRFEVEVVSLRDKGVVTF